VDFRVARVAIETQRRLRVDLSCPADALEPADPRDCLSLSAWTVIGARLARVLSADEGTATPSTLLLELDADPQPGATISVGLAPLARSAFGQPTATDALTVIALELVGIATQRAGVLGADLALPLVAGPGGDLDLAGQLEALLGEIGREVTTPLGAFAHLPDFGEDASPKRTYSQAEVAQKAARIAAELRKNPSVKSAQVTGRKIPPHLLRFDIEVIPTFSSKPITLRKDIQT
jgi:hypothetical protein